MPFTRDDTDPEPLMTEPRWPDVRHRACPACTAAALEVVTTTFYGAPPLPQYDMICPACSTTYRLSTDGQLAARPK
jgi:hypothetical protein